MIICPIDREGISYILSSDDNYLTAVIFSLYFNTKVPSWFPKFSTGTKGIG